MPRSRTTNRVASGVWTSARPSLIDAAPRAGAPLGSLAGRRAWVAQLVEQRIENPRVGGSNPPPGTTHLPRASAQIPAEAQPWMNITPPAFFPLIRAFLSAPFAWPLNFLGSGNQAELHRLSRQDQ